MKKKLSNFIGRNIARLKFAHHYVVIFASMITAISTFSLAIELPYFIVLLLFPITIIVVWFIGYTIDKKEIYRADITKTQMQAIEGVNIVHGQLWKKVIIPQLKEMILEVLKEMNEKKETHNNDIKEEKEGVGN